MDKKYGDKTTNFYDSMKNNIGLYILSNLNHIRINEDRGLISKMKKSLHDVRKIIPFHKKYEKGIDLNNLVLLYYNKNG